jgi:hypothetical protein
MVIYAHETRGLGARQRHFVQDRLAVVEEGAGMTVNQAFRYELDPNVQQRRSRACLEPSERRGP